MHTVTRAAGLTLAACWMIMIVGCQDDPPEVVLNGWYGYLVLVDAGIDTLWLQPGDVASTPISITVLDGDGHPAEGLEVSVEFSDTTLGDLQFLDPDLRDRTNDQGHVDLLFSAIGREGNERFTARAGGYVGSAELPIRYPHGLIGMLEVWLATDEQYPGPGSGGRVWIHVSAATPAREILSGVFVDAETSLGQEIAIPATNDSGLARAEWLIPRGVWEAWIAVCAGGLSDTAWYPPALGSP